MVTKKRFVLLGAVGLVASFLLISLTAGVFAQGTITPTPTAVRPMMPMGTPGAHMRDAAAVTATMPMSGTRPGHASHRCRDLDDADDFDGRYV